VTCARQAEDNEKTITIPCCMIIYKSMAVSNDKYMEKVTQCAECTHCNQKLEDIQ